MMGGVKAPSDELRSSLRSWAWSEEECECPLYSPSLMC